MNFRPGRLRSTVAASRVANFPGAYIDGDENGLLSVR